MDEVTPLELQIRQRIESLDEAGSLDYLDEQCDTWKLNVTGRSYADFLGTAFRNFEMPINGDVHLERSTCYGYRDIETKIREHELRLLALYQRLKTFQALKDTEVLRKITGVLNLVFYAKKIALAAFMGKLATHDYMGANIQLDDEVDDRLGSWMLKFGWIDSSSTNKLQKVMLYLLDVAMEKRLRKLDGMVYEPIIYGGHETHAWRQVGDMTTFIFANTKKEFNWEQWLNLTSSGGTARTVAELLNNCDDYQFPTLVKDRNVFSFRNGVYLAARDEFHPFETSPLSKSVVSAKFFDADFQWFEGAWQDIPTPHFQSIMDYQQWNEHEGVCDWMYIFSGRLLYDVGKVDNWQIIPYLKGRAGTGKSTLLLRVFKNFYEASDVGILSNNVERKFGLSAFHDKLIFMAPEIRADFNLEQSEFQCMVSGEELNVAVKHSTAFVTKWRPPGMMAGETTCFCCYELR